MARIMSSKGSDAITMKRSSLSDLIDLAELNQCIAEFEDVLNLFGTQCDDTHVDSGPVLKAISSQDSVGEETRYNANSPLGPRTVWSPDPMAEETEDEEEPIERMSLLHNRLISQAELLVTIVGKMGIGKKISDEGGNEKKVADCPAAGKGRNDKENQLEHNSSRTTNRSSGSGGGGGSGISPDPIDPDESSSTQNETNSSNPRCNTEPQNPPQETETETQEPQDSAPGPRRSKRIRIGTRAAPDPTAMDQSQKRGSSSTPKRGGPRGARRRRQGTRQRQRNTRIDHDMSSVETAALVRCGLDSVPASCRGLAKVMIMPATVTFVQAVIRAAQATSGPEASASIMQITPPGTSRLDDIAYYMKKISRATDNTALGVFRLYAHHIELSQAYGLLKQNNTPQSPQFVISLRSMVARQCGVTEITLKNYLQRGSKLLKLMGGHTDLLWLFCACCRQPGDFDVPSLPMLTQLSDVDAIEFGSRLRNNPWAAHMCQVGKYLDKIITHGQSTELGGMLGSGSSDLSLSIVDASEQELVSALRSLPTACLCMQ